MFTSNIGRIRFLASSVVLLVAEAIAVLMCVAGTMGIERLANSRPGPGRKAWHSLS